MKFESLGDSAVVATVGSHIDAKTLAAVRSLAGAVAASGREGVVDVVPAYATVTVFYEPSKFAGEAQPYDAVCEFVAACAKRGSAAKAHAARRVEIPVCYGGDFGPDLGEVAGHAKLTEQEVILLHSKADYLVHAIGFTPGFPYLGGLPKALRVPRRDTPRARVPAGSVAIGGSQTGVYPVESPGGWQVIGRTPLSLFQADRKPAALLRPGDLVLFKAISQADFKSWKSP
jgi:inhibitor of KinA